MVFGVVRMGVTAGDRVVSADRPNAMNSRREGCSNNSLSDETCSLGLGVKNRSFRSRKRGLRLAVLKLAIGKHL
jgi:hypothetical protein